MADPIGALVDALRADAATTALAGTDIYGAELPREAVARMPLNAIVIKATGGPTLTGASDAAVDAQRIDLIAYGRTPFGADLLRRTAGRALLDIRRRLIGDTLIHWVNRAGGFSAARERDGQWPQAFQSFQIFHSLEGDV